MSKSDVTLSQVLEKLNDNRRFMEKQFNALKTNIDQLTKRITDIESKQQEYEQALTFCGEEIADVKLKLSDMDDIRQKLKNLEESQAADNNKVRQLQTDKSLKTLRICGIPKTHNEDLTYIMSKLANQLSCSPITKADLETVFRPKNSDQSPSSTIVVRFNSLLKRDEFYNGRKLLGKNNVTVQKLGLSGDNKIYINESLTKATNTLFYKARQCKKDLNYQYVWTHHGQIFMRKTKESDMIKITDQAVLDNLS